MNKTAEDVVAEVKQVILKYTLDLVLNAGQIIFNYEMASHRMLSYSGEKITYVSVKSLNATNTQ